MHATVQAISSPSLEPNPNDYSLDIQNWGLEDKKGLLIIICMDDALGAKIDAENMKKVASTLGFAVREIISPSHDQLRAVVRRVKKYRFIHKAPSCKAIIFYYSGHGGSNSTNLKPFVLTREKSLYVENIVSPLDPINAPGLKHIKRLFFFDMCQVLRVDPKRRAPSASAQPVLKYAVPAKGNSLIAFAGSIGYAVRGDALDGGYWTRHLIKYLDKDMDIHIVLAKTWKDTVKFTSNWTDPDEVQGPTFFSCMGPLKLTCKFLLIVFVSVFKYCNL